MRSFHIQHTVTIPAEGISQVWNRVATDNNILSYIADTLLISFQDKKCLMVLKTKYSDQPNKCWDMLGVLHMEHHTPIIEETEKEVCFQTLGIPINTIDILIH